MPKLVTNVEGMANVVHKRLCREDLMSGLKRRREEPDMLLQAVVEGCRENVQNS